MDSLAVIVVLGIVAVGGAVVYVLRNQSGTAGVSKDY